MKPVPNSVSIVVAGRNAAPWIDQALASALMQTVPCQVIFVDDCSTDATLARARTYEQHGLTVLALEKHQGVCAARNRGAAKATGEYLCFLDADDMMPETYIADHLAAMEPGCAFVYGAARAFGDGPHAGRLWPAAAWDEWDRWSYNTVNTSALYDARIFRRAGGWVDVPTMWDHDLALRASRFGSRPPKVSAAVLHYRQHAQSFSSSLNEKEGELVEIRELIRRRNAQFSVATIYSGRLPGLFPQWIERVAQSVRFAALRPELVIAVDPRVDPSAFPRDKAEVWSSSFRSIEFITLAPMDEWTTEVERRGAVARWLASSMDRVRYRCDADLIWLVEDDILVPHSACRELWNLATSGVKPPAMVSGIYRSRHSPSLLIAGRVQKVGNRLLYPEATVNPGGIVPMDFVGTGCAMIWKQRPMIPAVWPSHAGGEIPAHDWAISLEIKRQGGDVLWHTGVQCGHASTMNDVLWP